MYLTVAIIAAVFFDRVVFRPLSNRLSNLNGEILVQEKKLTRAMNILKDKDLIAKEHSKYSKDIKQLRSDEEAIALLLSDVEKLAKNSSVSFIDVKPSPVEEAQFYKKYTIKIEAEGKIGHLADFMYRLEKLPKLFRITEFRLSPKKNEPDILSIYLVVTQILII